ncbi:dephospho-CoA kinase [Aurantibacter sp.]|uniref:dephospho-CoA kinase n=1 Tax=Aurantibacter sp. TaxID=2807103 RepID=UPI0035C84573
MTPLKVGLTGGIGSGKTTVANLFSEFGIPIYIADLEAKKLMVTSKVLIRQLKQLLGEEVYVKGELNRQFVASKIFKDEVLLKKINAIVHPKVARHFKRWFVKQKAPYVISESALIFENNTQDNYDIVISVIANKDIRIARVVSRDTSNREKVEAIMSHQTTDEIKKEKSDFVIINDEISKTKEIVKKIHNSLLKVSEK